MGVSSRTTCGTQGARLFDPWSGGLPGCFKDTARGQLFRNWSEEVSNRGDNFGEVLRKIYQPIFADKPTPLTGLSSILGEGAR